MKKLIFIFFIAATSCTSDHTEEQKAALIAAAHLKKQKIIKQLLEDCTANLPAKTYKKAQQLQKEARHPAARKRS